MREEEINTLIKQLRDQGFDVDKFAEELRRKVNRPGSKFSIEQTIEFGAVALHCKLWFTKKHRSDKFTFRCYDASYMHEINLPHKIFGDLDTGKLEKRMQKIDWKNLEFKQPSGHLNERWQLIKATKNIIGDLERLDENDWQNPKESNERGRLANMLKMRYLSDTVFETAHFRQLCQSIQRRRTFHHEHIKVAFQIVSEKIKTIDERLCNAHFYCPDIQIAEQVSSGKSNIALYDWCNFSEGMLHYRIPFVKLGAHGNSGDYHPRPIEATLIPHSKIDYKSRVNGISIGRLDKKMKKIDWRQHYKKIRYSDAPEHWLHNPAIATTINMLKEIESDQAGKEIALNLKLKYWIGTPLFEGVVAKARLEQKKTFHKQTFKWFTDTLKVFEKLYEAYLRHKPTQQKYCRIRRVPGK